MIKFTRYPHVYDLFQHYASEAGRADILLLLESGIKTDEEAEILCRFAWKIAEMVNEDEEHGKFVPGSTDNTDMLPDLSYEMSKYMKEAGFYSIWLRVSEEEML